MAGSAMVRAENGHTGRHCSGDPFFDSSECTRSNLQAGLPQRTKLNRAPPKSRCPTRNLQSNARSDGARATRHDRPRDPRGRSQHATACVISRQLPAHTATPVVIEPRDQGWRDDVVATSSRRR